MVRADLARDSALAFGLPAKKSCTAKFQKAFGKGEGLSAKAADERATRPDKASGSTGDWAAEERLITLPDDPRSGISFRVSSQ